MNLYWALAVTAKQSYFNRYLIFLPLYCCHHMTDTAARSTEFCYLTLVLWLLLLNVTQFEFDLQESD